jgi:hypothetical protein
MWMIVWWIISMVVSALLAPKPKVENAKASSANEANFPTASSTTTLAVVWGKIRLRIPNVVWYGDFLTVPITRTQESDGFFGIGAKSVTQTIGYKYYWGQHLVLCHGQVTLHNLWADERLIWSGTSTGGQVSIDNEGFYGGEERGGGIVALIDFYSGDTAQTPNSYLAAMLGAVPNYRGVSSLVWRGPSGGGISYQVPGIIWTMLPGDNIYTKSTTMRTFWKTSGYIGTSPQPQPINAEVSRYPNVLGDGYSRIGDDANPAHIIYECLTNDPLGEDGWGLGMATAMIDLPSFLDCSQKLHTEGFGVSMSWESPAGIDEVIADLCKCIDAQCYRDFSSGKMKMKLIRNDYVVSSLPVLDESNILDFSNFDQGTIEGTTNEVVVKFKDRSKGYKANTAQAQDMANMRQQNDVSSQSIDYPWITLYPLADRVANRDLLSVSVPMAKAEVIVNREAYAYGPGDPFKITWPKLNIDQIIMRVKSVSIGMPLANKIKLTLIQDVFSLNSTAYTDPGDTGWVDPLPAPTPVAIHQLMEAPYLLNQNKTYAQYLYLAARPNIGSYSFELLDKKNGDTDNFTSRGIFQRFSPTGVINNDYPASFSVDDTGTLVVTGNPDMAKLTNSTEPSMRNGANLFVFATTGEVCSFSDMIQNSDGVTYTLFGVWRGLMDTIPVAHSSGERIFFLEGSAFPPNAKYGQTDPVSAYSITAGPKGVSVASATINKTMANRNVKPVPPGRILINAIARPLTITGSISPTWEHRNLTTDALQVIRQDDLGSSAAEGTYGWQLQINGVSVDTATGLTTKTWARGPYTPAQRIASGYSGKYLMEFKIRQTTAGGSSVYNSSGQFQMSGFGMCFGQVFGGV